MMVGGHEADDAACTLDPPTPTPPHPLCPPPPTLRSLASLTVPDRHVPTGHWLQTGLLPAGPHLPEHCLKEGPPSGSVPTGHGGGPAQGT